jgi:outer membrane protein assembly factor BamE
VHPASRALILAAPIALAACSPPQIIKPYRMEIQQGNYISQEMASKLKLGMSKDQVRFVLGTPLVTDIFHADRWDYVYYRDTQRGGREERKIAVVFENGKLARVLGDVLPAAPKEESAAVKDAAPPTPVAPKPVVPGPVAEPLKPAAEPPPTQNWRAASDEPAQGDQAKEETKEEPKAESQSERGFFGRMLEKLGF